MPANADPLAPPPSSPPLKDDIGTSAFSLADPVPDWVEQVPLPDADTAQ